MRQTEKGLTEAQAAARLGQVGENRLAGKKGPGMAAMFFSQFKDVMILILAAATLISVLMGEGTEAITIIIIVLMNATMGFFQEYRTEKTLEALKELSAPVARVRRGGVEKNVSARTIVPGDILLLEAGDKIAADGTLSEGTRLACNESMLTGESLPVEKKNGDPLFMGCVVTEGRGEAVVTATGMSTEMGKIAGLMEEAAEDPTPLQKKLKQLGVFVATACVIVCLAVAFLGFLQGNGFLEMLLTGVSLAVAAIPEGLPAIVTITLALSVGRILRRGAVIRKLHAVESLGCAGVICTDKTGTVTQNRMTVQRIWVPGHICEVSGTGYHVKGEITENGRTVTAPFVNDLLRTGVLCSTAHIEQKQGEYRVDGDPTEVAVLIAAAKAGLTRQKLLRSYTITGENPFDSKRKCMSVSVRSGHGQQLCCKGAPDVLLDRCSTIQTEQGIKKLGQRERREVEAAMAAMAQNALRVLGFAVSDTPEKGESDLCFLGLMGMQDPPRPEVKQAVRKCRSAGIKPVMITGDYRETALAIAKQTGIAGINDGVLTGKELDAMSDEQLSKVCMHTAVYARVTPAHKLRIVRAYKKAGQITAMTGDGVNDAPAVKEADIGVAMGATGTDVTKEASSVVILDDNFATIVSAVEEGRVIYQNIRRFIRFLLTSNLGEVLGMLFGMLLRLPVMLLPIQILLVNLFTDGLPAIALGMEPPAKDIMERPPRPKEEGLFAHGLARTILIRGTMLGLASSGAYWAVLSTGGDITLARSACFMTIVFSQMLHIFECRGEGLHFGGNPALLGAAGLSLACTALSVYLPVLQKFFGTSPVLGKNLFIVAVAVLAGPAIMTIIRRVRRLLQS
ncbi:cation-translocating P-type ATPase [uncultured Ruthenibacterium sp.]|uniref:cation-translocating P-type ATPase n=1 Tax=uncultured Ruthenibacterium sp. TaxID=1905347 RepID=UPI00349EDAE4